MEPFFTLDVTFCNKTYFIFEKKIILKIWWSFFKVPFQFSLIQNDRQRFLDQYKIVVSWILGGAPQNVTIL